MFVCWSLISRIMKEKHYFLLLNCFYIIFHIKYFIIHQFLLDYTYENDRPNLVDPDMWIDGIVCGKNNIHNKMILMEPCEMGISSFLRDQDKYRSQSFLGTRTQATFSLDISIIKIVQIILYALTKHIWQKRLSGSCFIGMF